MKKFDLVFDDSIEKHIMAMVFKKQIRLREVFKDYDPLRKGTVTEDKVTYYHIIILTYIVQIISCNLRNPFKRIRYPKVIG